MSEWWPTPGATPRTQNVTDYGTGTVTPADGILVFVPKGHGFYIFPTPDDPTDDGSAVIDHAEALHHVHDLLENGEDG